MVRPAIVLSCLFAAALPAPVFAEEVYYVRNDTHLAFTCGLRREPTRKVYRFLLRAGEEHSQAMAGGRERSLLCDSRPLHTQRFRMRSGVRYALVRDGEGVVALRPIATAP